MLQLPFFLFFFNGTATTDIYTLSLHDALPIFSEPPVGSGVDLNRSWGRPRTRLRRWVSATNGHICSGVTEKVPRASKRRAPGRGVVTVRGISADRAAAIVGQSKRWTGRLCSEI